jgi:DnaJ-class molecular chaperone
MKRFFQRVPDALQRVLVLFLVVIGVALLVRALLPAEMKDTSIQVKNTIEHEMARSVKYAGSDACTDCHEEAKLKKEGYHKNLSCETCHGAAKVHAENPTETKPTLPRMREFCSGCHTYNPSRPSGFPQIVPAAHNPLKPCVECHNPHDPRPPKTPTECSACHAGIARTKALSPHVQLECTECHATPQQHKLSPRAVLASIPSDRSFCGKCHAKGTGLKDAPKVDMVSHGEKYLCWQCHYPHMPEVQ